MRSDFILSISSKRALRRLGKDLTDARKRRRLPCRIVCQRCGISRVTLSKIEKGDGTVALQYYVTVLFVYGMIDRVESLVDKMTDRAGVSIYEEENLPKRVRLKKQVG